MDNLEKRVAALEAGMVVQEARVNALMLAYSNLIKRFKTIEEDMVNLIADIEADGNSTAIAIQNMKAYVNKLTRFSHALDAKNTALARLFCRTQGLDPDTILEEYKCVMDDLQNPDWVDEFIEETKVDPEP